MMITIWMLLSTVLSVALMAQDASGAALQGQPRQHRHHRRRDQLARLQDTVDNLLLRQEIDHILLTNLQREVEELREGKSDEHLKAAASSGAETPFAASVRMMETEGRALAALGERVAEMRETMTETLQTEKHRDDITQLKQEVTYLRSEVQRLKSSRASESEASAAHAHAHEQREAVTVAWVADSIRHLQDSVADLQQSFNISQAMHDKQEVESRLLVVTKDVSALRGTLAAVTSKAEAAAATSEALQEELTRTSGDQHRLAGRLASLTTEVSTIREDFDDLLKALPEGTVSGTPVPTSLLSDQVASGVAASGVAAAVVRASQVRQEERMARLERRTDSLDFALTRTQKKLSSLSPASGIDQRVAEITEAERQLETRVEAATTGVGEVKSSSVKLLAALEALEARMEKEVAEVRQEVAKMEFTVGQSAAERQSGQEDARVAHDDTSALRSDLQVVSRHLEDLTLKTEALEGRKLEDDVILAQCRSQQLSFDIRLNDALQRLQQVEQRLRRHHPQDGHKYHLPKWSDAPGDARKRRRRSLSPSG
nr:nuclear mitotic apparatus protein 1-like [Cherax quadricarinatus]